MHRLSSRTIVISSIALLLIVLQVLALLPNMTTPLVRMEVSARDLLMRARPAQQRSGQIAIVGIDDDSISWTGYRWPWPRAYLAKIVDRLNQAGAKVIALDLFLSEPDADPQGDLALAQAIAQANASAGVTNIFRSEKISGGMVLRTETEQIPLELYQKSFSRIGITPITLDEDAILRDVQVYDQLAGKTYIHWAFEMVSLYQGVPEPANFSETSVTFNGREIPLIKRRLLVNYSGPAGSYPTYSASSVAEGDIPAEAFKGKIVLIGATTPTLQDLWPTPYSTSDRTPGVEVVANAVDTILTGQYLSLAPPWVNLLETLLMAVAAALILRLREPVRIVAGMAAGLMVFVASAFLLFVFQGFVLALVAPGVMLFLGVILPTMGQAVSQELEKRRLRSLFGRFLSSEIIDQMVTSSDLSALNKRTNITVLFSDIRGFTTLSEKLLPEQVVALLNPYLEAMTEIIYRNGGTVDKYEGDAVMAFFGEPVAHPDHALRAARTALEMHLSLDGLRKHWHAKGILPADINFQIGIGLNSGPAFVGLLGSEQRINYTAIGDNVNLSARLQDLTKTYKWPILISEATYKQIKDEFDAQFVEVTVVKGKTEPVRMYRLLGRKGAPEEERVRALEI
jgi:adenylate cyclase